ncbi:hypothetical protein HDN1F_35070 [gamma proteobacterium HdN1]|nr:Hypothetical protein HDN1F_18120 [gamma proteobacterium HdN1]CBL47090.1 hypothetical protein HDN1F_35070 [gamma proteobacterium HdN1]
MPALHLVNEQPPVLLGLSEDEFILVLVVSFISSAIGSCLAFELVWHWWAGLIFLPITTVFTMRSLAALLCKKKRGKPQNYYPLLLKQWIEKTFGGGASTYVGPWSIVRRNRFSGLS